MSDNSLRSIGIRVEGEVLDTGNALPVLHEILHALRRLDEAGEPTTIDLRSIPFGPGDEERLLRTLGEGELRASVDSLGRTEIWETSFHGVWLVDHRDAGGARTGLQVEVTDVPALIRTPADDITDAVAMLERVLDTTADMPSQEGTR